MSIPRWDSPIIHVSYSMVAGKRLPCRVAIVTGIEHQPKPIVHAAVFRERGDIAGAAAFDPTVEGSWHYPSDCPNTYTAEDHPHL